MALICPVTIPQSPDGGCVGHFVSADQLHLVSPDGYDLVFEQLVPQTSQKAVRLPIAVNGRIIGLHRVPISSYASLDEQTETDTAPDMLLIHTQTKKSSSGENTASNIENHLHFKLYNSSSKELSTVSVFSCYGGPYHPLSSTWFALDVCLNAGPMLGTVAFASSGNHDTHFIDPFNVKAVSVYSSNDSRGPAQNGGIPHWINTDLIVLTRKRSDQMSYAIDFLKIDRRAKNAKSSFKLSSIDRATLPPGLRAQGIGSYPLGEKGTMVNVILSDDTVNTYAIKKNTVELVDEKRLDLHKKDPALVQRFGLSGKSKYRNWFPLPAKRDTESYFVSDDSVVLMVKGVGKFDLFKVDVLPQRALLSPLGLGIFKVLTDISSVVELVKISAGENANEPSIHHDFLKPRSYEFNNAKLVKHEYNSFFGSCFWFSFKGSMSNYLCKSERTILTRFRAIPNYPFTAPLTGVWSVGSKLLVSTVAQSAMYEFDGSQLRRTASEFDGDVCTIAAAPGVQITRDMVRLSGGLAISLPLSPAVSAAIDGTRVIVASADTVFVIQDGHVVKKMTFNDVIVGVDCRDSILAVCTASALHVCYEKSGEKEVCELRELATSVACGANGHVYVGDAEGDLFLWPEQQYLNVAPNPVKSIRAQDDGVTVLAGPHGSVHIGIDQRFVRFQVGDANDILLNAINDYTGLAVVDGILKFLDVDADAGMVPHLVDASELLHSRPEDMKIWGDFVYSFGVSRADRRLHRAPLSNIQLLQSFEIPPFTETDISDFQVFMLSETKFLEFAKKESNKSESDPENDEDDDSDFDDFETHILVRLYELQSDLGKITILNEKEFDLAGDPYEEIIVKFYSPYDFILFTHSSSAVQGSTDPQISGTLKIGRPTSCYEYLYDDHWISSNNGGVIVVSFSGDVSLVSARELRESDPLVNCFKNPSKNLGNIAKSSGSSEAVFDVLEIPGSAQSSRLVTTSRDKSGEPVSRASLVEITENQLLRVANVQVHDRSLSLSSISENASRSLLNSELNGQSTYLKSLLPDVAIGTSRGGVYLWSSIKDKNLFNALLKVQNELRHSIEMLDSAVVQDESSIDGALLMAALSMPEAEPLVSDAGLDAAELKKALAMLIS